MRFLNNKSKQSLSLPLLYVLAAKQCLLVLRIYCLPVLGAKFDVQAAEIRSKNNGRLLLRQLVIYRAADCWKKKTTQQLIHDETSIVPPSGNQQHKSETLNLTAAAAYNMFYVTDEVLFGHLKIFGTDSSLNSGLFLSP